MTTPKYTSNSGIYRIVNILNNKCYIGQTVNFPTRKNSHFSPLRHNTHYNRHLQRAFEKYGSAAFIFEILEIVEFPPNFSGNKKAYCDYLKPYEQKWLDFYNSADPEFGYNISPTSGSPLGVKHSDETKKKQSEARRGEKNARYGKTGTQNPNYGKPMSDRQRAQISAATKGRVVSEETRRKLSIINAGERQSVESCSKVCVNRYVITSPDGLRYAVKSLKRFCDDFSLTRAAMRRAMQGVGRCYKGYTGHYMSEEETKVYEPLLNGKLYCEI